MEKEKAELKAELMLMYEKELDVMLSECEAAMDFAEIEKQVEKLGKRVLTEVLSASSEKLASFSPKLS